MFFTSNLRDHVEEPVGLHLHAHVYQLAEVEGDEAGLFVLVDIPGEVHSGDLHLGAGPGTHQVAGVPATTIIIIIITLVTATEYLFLLYTSAAVALTSARQMAAPGMYVLGRGITFLSGT